MNRGSSPKRRLGKKEREGTRLLTVQAAIAGSPGRARQQEGERGYVLLVLLLFSALIVIGLLRVLPAMVVQSQREKEEELLFRGQQYQRAIQLFVRRFGRYPNALEELEETNNIRFLRKRYRDVMTRGGEWRLIHIGPGGEFPDALTAANAPSQSPSSAPSAPESSGSASQQTSASTGPGSNPSQPSSGGTAAGMVTSLFQASPPATGEPALRPSANPTASPQQQPRAAATAQQPAPIVFGGGGIAGVASESTAESLKIWSGQSQYDHWEFIYNFRTDPLGMAALARVSGAVAPTTAPPGTPTQPPVFTPQPAGQDTPFSPPRWLGGPPPGVRPTPGPFPPSPIPPPATPPRSR